MRCVKCTRTRVALLVAGDDGWPVTDSSVGCVKQAESRRQHLKRRPVAIFSNSLGTVFGRISRSGDEVKCRETEVVGW